MDVRRRDFLGPFNGAGIRVDSADDSRVIEDVNAVADENRRAVAAADRIAPDFHARLKDGGVRAGSRRSELVWELDGGHATLFGGVHVFIAVDGDDDVLIEEDRSIDPVFAGLPAEERLATAGIHANNM